MFNHNLLSPFLSLGAEDVICLQKLLKYVPGFIFVCMYLCMYKEGMFVI